MKDMGRPKSVNKNLPPRMIRQGRNYYYNKSAKKRIPLGKDLALARLEWAKIENGSSAPGTFASTSESWRAAELGKRGPYTQVQYEKYLSELLKAFGHIPIGKITTGLCRQYLNRRTAKVMANREIALLSTIFNWARELDLTQSANPVTGMRKNKEPGRKVYVTDEQFRTAYEKCVYWVQDAMDLLLLTSQHPGDVLMWTRHHISSGLLEFVQAKTGKAMRIEIEGELKNVLERILARPGAVSSIYLVADEKGQRVTVDRLQKKVKKARGEMTWQVRDIRKKAGTDVDDLRRAQGLLGHASEATTAKFYRQMKGDKVKPLR